jgi:hypothetical protein
MLISSKCKRIHGSKNLKLYIRTIVQVRYILILVTHVGFYATKRTEHVLCVCKYYIIIFFVAFIKTMNNRINAIINTDIS